MKWVFRPCLTGIINDGMPKDGILKNGMSSNYIILVCLKMIYTCTLYPIQWKLAKNEGHSVKLQTILH